MEAIVSIDTPTAEQRATSLVISTERLRPNAYNPNAMTPDEFGELVAEVRHLGRLPKPIVARPDGDGYGNYSPCRYGWWPAPSSGAGSPTWVGE